MNYIAMPTTLTPEELRHAYNIVMSIERTIAGETMHGSFVKHMAAKEYGLASMYADATMARCFCDLVKWRERLDDADVKQSLEGKIHT